MRLPSVLPAARTTTFFLSNQEVYTKNCPENTLSSVRMARNDQCPAEATDYLGVMRELTSCCVDRVMLLLSIA